MMLTAKAHAAGAARACASSLAAGPAAGLRRTWAPAVVSMPSSGMDRRERAASVTARAVKKWVKPEINQNTGKAKRKEMHVREGDTVKVISGKDKGKVGEVVKVYRKGLKAGKILVDDVNLVKKALKPKQTMGGEEQERGKIILTEAPIHHSNVMLFSKDKQCVSRVGHKVVDGKKLRYLVKTGEVLAEVPRKTRPQQEEDGVGEGGEE